MTIRKALIVGGGIGGLCSAVALLRQGIAVDLLEIKSEWTVYGVGIIQQSNVVREMAHLGLLDRYLDAAYAFDDVAIYDAQGKQLARVTGDRLAGPRYPANVGISRLKLHQVLSQAAAEMGAQIRLGTTVEELDQGADSVAVAFSDGSSDRYDLVIGADGLYSKVRQLLFGDRYQPRFTGQAGWRHNFSRPPEVDHLMTFMGPDGNAGLVPLATDLMYLFLTSHEPGNPWMEGEQLVSRMRQHLKPFDGLVGELRGQIQDPAQVVYKPFEVVFVSEPWFKGRVLLIGDAAHGTTPHFGQGAGMAIEDAVVLGHLAGEGGAVNDMLEAFVARRMERCRFISDISVLAGEKEIERDHAFDRIGYMHRMLEFTAAPVI